MASLDWIDAAAIWLPAHKYRLDHLLRDPIESCPAFTLALLGLPLDQFVFWERPGPARIRGWAITHGTLDARSWNILRGDEVCFEAYLRNLSPTESQAFEYVREEERSHYARYLDVEPVPFAYRYEITRGAFVARSMDPTWLKAQETCKVQAFEPGRAHDWFEFQGYPAQERAFSVYPRLDGSWLTVDGKIVASVHDGLSMLPFKVPEAFISGIKVAESARGKGACKALLNAFLDRLFHSGKLRAGLFVDVHNEPAKRCYERVGFIKKQLYYKVELEPVKSSS